MGAMTNFCMVKCILLRLKLEYFNFVINSIPIVMVESRFTNTFFLSI